MPGLPDEEGREGGGDKGEGVKYLRPISNKLKSPNHPPPIPTIVAIPPIVWLCLYAGIEQEKLEQYKEQ